MFQYADADTRTSAAQLFLLVAAAQPLRPTAAPPIVLLPGVSSQRTEDSGCFGRESRFLVDFWCVVTAYRNIAGP